MKNSKFCGNKKVLSGAWRSEEEWSCPNTGDGCNGILSLNDVHRGQRVITSSQLVYQPERDGEKKSQEEDPATSWPALLPFRVVSTVACVFHLLSCVSWVSHLTMAVEQKGQISHQQIVKLCLHVQATRCDLYAVAMWNIRVLWFKN